MKGKPATICFPFVGDTVGGSHISAIKLIEGLDRDQFNPLIVLHDDTAELAKLISRLGLPFFSAGDVPLLQPRRAGAAYAQTRSILTYMTRSLPRMRSFLRDHEVDIVHTNDGRIHLNWALAARTTGAKHLWHHRGNPNAKGVNLAAPLLADHIVTVSNFARPRRPVLPVGHKTTVVHSPFDHPESIPDRDQSRLAIINELGCSPSTRFLGYFGSLIDRKRPVAFVDIVHAYAKRHPDIPIAGLLFGVPPPDGPRLDLAVRERAQQLGIADRIHLMGFRQPIEPCMCAVDILLIPALNEPFGRTLIEAMFLGTPVIATNHGGNPEAITDGENGLLVEPENAEAFVDPIHRFLTDHQFFRQISEKARTRALSRYSVAKHVDSITSIYNRLLPRPVGRSIASPRYQEPKA